MPEIASPKTLSVAQRQRFSHMIREAHRLMAPTAPNGLEQRRVEAFNKWIDKASDGEVLISLTQLVSGMPSRCRERIT